MLVYITLNQSPLSQVSTNHTWPIPPDHMSAQITPRQTPLITCQHRSHLARPPDHISAQITPSQTPLITVCTSQHYSVNVQSAYQSRLLAAPTQWTGNHSKPSTLHTNIINRNWSLKMFEWNIRKWKFKQTCRGFRSTRNSLDMRETVSTIINTFKAF